MYMYIHMDTRVFICCLYLNTYMYYIITYVHGRKRTRARSRQAHNGTRIQSNEGFSHSNPTYDRKAQQCDRPVCHGKLETWPWDSNETYCMTSPTGPSLNLRGRAQIDEQEAFQTQRVQLDGPYGLRAQKPYMVCFLGLIQYGQSKWAL